MKTDRQTHTRKATQILTGTNTRMFFDELVNKQATVTSSTKP